MHPILFDLGPLQIRYYGLMYAVAIIVGSFLIKGEVRRRNISMSDDDVMNFIIWTVVCGVLGARIYYVAFNLDYYLKFPLEIPAIWHGGLAIHGGLGGGFLFAWLFLKKMNIRFWQMADATAPAIILGQAFGRFGNFMNGDAHGRPTDMPWGIVFPQLSIAGAEFPGIPIHPTMLYEMCLNLSIFALLWFWLRKKEFGDGFIFATYVVLYSTGRSFVEHFRADSLMIGGFDIKAAQAVSVVLIVAAASVIITKKLWKARP